MVYKWPTFLSPKAPGVKRSNTRWSLFIFAFTFRYRLFTTKVQFKFFAIRLALSIILMVIRTLRDTYFLYIETKVDTGRQVDISMISNNEFLITFVGIVKL